MKQNEEEVQYYYDSSADQWWCFDNRQQCWVPWKEEESEDAGHLENTVAPARVTGEATANGAAASDEATRQDTTGSTAVVDNTRENAADTSEPLASSGEPGDTEGVGGRRPSTLSPSCAADSVASHAKDGEAQYSTTAGSSAARGVVATVETSEKATDHGGTSREIKGSTEARVVAASAAACRSEATAAADVDRTSTRRAAGATERRTTSGVDLTAADDKHQQQLLRDNAEENEAEEKEKDEEDTSVHEVDRLRSALESLATSRCLDQALMQIRASGSLNRTLPSTGGGGPLTERVDETKYKAPAGRVDQLSSAGSGKVLGLRGMSLSQKIDEEHTQEENEDEDDQDVVGELPDIVKPDPIVRRSTRMLTFKDKGGLAGCLREAAKQRNDMIKEAGGYIPGTEEYREEAWKQRARALASQTHVRTRNKWKEAARKVFDASGGKTPEDKVMHFADLVDRIRRKSEGDGGKAKRAEADLSRFATYSLGSMSTVPSKSTTPVDPEIVAANLLLKPDVDLREQRRRSSGFTGGQQGHVRFADAAFRDPNSQLQMQDLLTQQSRRKVTSRKEDAAFFVEAFRKQESREQGESIE